MPKLRTIQAINLALHEEMERDPSVVLFGEDVEISIFADTLGLHERFGPQRVRNTPISENLMTGMAVGAAASGLRVICHMMYGNFMLTGMDGIANQAAKLSYMTGGQIRLPIVYHGTYGGGRSAAAQHSDAGYGLFANLGGLKVVVPGSPASARALMKAAVRDDSPVVFLQSAGRGGERGEVPDEIEVEPLGRALVRRAGEDVTLVAVGAMVKLALDAANRLEPDGISVEVIDPQTIAPLDSATILSSVRRTGRLVVADEAHRTCGFAATVAALAAEQAFDVLKAPVGMVTRPDCPAPYSPVLEQAMFPTAETIADAVKAAVVGENRI
jgi:pyruvate dehydrogenase E1 component beta subunit